MNERAVMLALLALFLFVSPFVAWWARPQSPWYLPYLLWAFVILLGALAQWHGNDPDEL